MVLVVCVGDGRVCGWRVGDGWVRSGCGWRGESARVHLIRFHPSPLGHWHAADTPARRPSGACRAVARPFLRGTRGPTTCKAPLGLASRMSGSCKLDHLWSAQEPSGTARCKQGTRRGRGGGKEVWRTDRLHDKPRRDVHSSVCGTVCKPGHTGRNSRGGCGKLGAETAVACALQLIAMVLGRQAGADHVVGEASVPRGGRSGKRPASLPTPRRFRAAGATSAGAAG